MYASFGSRVTSCSKIPELIPARTATSPPASARCSKAGRRIPAERPVNSFHGRRRDCRHAGERRHRRQPTPSLLATGRRPPPGGLNLAAAGVETDERGAIRVSNTCTSAPNIYAIGDVTGGLQFTHHISLDDCIIRDELFGDGGRTTGPVPYSVFIARPVARRDARGRGPEAGLDIRVTKIAGLHDPRARILGPAEGIFKAVIDAETDLILGCTLFGPESTRSSTPSHWP